MAQQTITLTITLADNDEETAAGLMAALKDGSCTIADLLGCCEPGTDKVRLSVENEGETRESEEIDAEDAASILS